MSGVKMKVMNDFKNFKFKSVLTPDEQMLKDKFSAEFYEDENHQDWYKLQSLFSSATWKIIYDSAGVINSVSNDVSMLRPLGMSVAEVSSLPSGFDINNGWMFNGSDVFPVQETMESAASKKSSLLAVAAAEIAPLQDAADIDIATDEELMRLMAWKKYRVMLSRIDVSKAPEIEWPEVPEDVA